MTGRRLPSRQCGPRRLAAWTRSYEDSEERLTAEDILTEQPRRPREDVAIAAPADLAECIVGGDSQADRRQQNRDMIARQQCGRSRFASLRKPKYPDMQPRIIDVDDK